MSTPKKSKLSYVGILTYVLFFLAAAWGFLHVLYSVAWGGSWIVIIVYLAVIYCAVRALRFAVNSAQTTHDKIADGIVSDITFLERWTYVISLPIIHLIVFLIVAMMLWETREALGLQERNMYFKVLTYVVLGLASWFAMQKYAFSLMSYRVRHQDWPKPVMVIGALWFLYLIGQSRLANALDGSVDFKIIYFVEVTKKYLYHTFS